MRKITIDDAVYLWKREHLHLIAGEPCKCIEKVVIYLEGYKKSPLQLFFREEDNLKFKTDIEKEKWKVGYPDDGVIWLYRQPLLVDLYSNNQEQTIEINLNRPAVIAALIRYFLQTDWNPKQSTSPYIIKEALKFLEIIALPKGI